MEDAEDATCLQCAAGSRCGGHWAADGVVDLMHGVLQLDTATLLGWDMQILIALLRIGNEQATHCTDSTGCTTVHSASSAGTPIAGWLT